MLPALGLARPRGAQEEAATFPAESEAVLAAIAGLVLPADALGADGIAKALAGFRRWRDGFEPVAELDHPYLSSDEIRYGPPDPRPSWSSQCAALETEAQKRHGASFVELSAGDREALLVAQIEPVAQGPADASLPEATRAPHVALALVSWYFSTPAANDLCYGRAIGRHSCRGLPSAVELPASLEASDAGGGSLRGVGSAAGSELPGGSGSAGGLGS